MHERFICGSRIGLEAHPRDMSYNTIPRKYVLSAVFSTSLDLDLDLESDYRTEKTGAFAWGRLDESTCSGLRDEVELEEFALHAYRFFERGHLLEQSRRLIGVGFRWVSGERHDTLLHSIS